MNIIAFAVIAILMLASALAAACLRNLIHATLWLVVTFVAIAALYFLLGAEFVGLVQIFVYVGAVAILIVFTILLTRRESADARGFNWSGAAIAILVLAGLEFAVMRTPALVNKPAPGEALTVRRIGETLMTDFAWPLLCVGVLLTAALIGALVLVKEDRQ